MRAGSRQLQSHGRRSGAERRRAQPAARVERRLRDDQGGDHLGAVEPVLFSAADKGCEPLARRLLAAGASVQARDRLGAMPLAARRARGSLRWSICSCEKGAPIDARNLAGSTALYAAAENDRLAVVRRLLAKGADPKVPGRAASRRSLPRHSRATTARQLLLDTAPIRTRSTDRQGADPLCGRRSASRRRAAVARCRRRRQCPLRQRSDRVDVGGGLSEEAGAPTPRTSSRSCWIAARTSMLPTTAAARR